MFGTRWGRLALSTPKRDPVTNQTRPPTPNDPSCRGTRSRRRETATWSCVRKRNTMQRIAHHACLACGMMTGESVGLSQERVAGESATRIAVEPAVADVLVSRNDSHAMPAYACTPAVSCITDSRQKTSQHAPVLLERSGPFTVSLTQSNTAAHGVAQKSG